MWTSGFSLTKKESRLGIRRTVEDYAFRLPTYDSKIWILSLVNFDRAAMFSTEKVD